MGLYRDNGGGPKKNLYPKTIPNPKRNYIGGSRYCLRLRVLRRSVGRGRVEPEGSQGQLLETPCAKAKSISLKSNSQSTKPQILYPKPLKTRI